MDERDEGLAKSLVCARERDFSVIILHRKLEVFCWKKSRIAEYRGAEKKRFVIRTTQHGYGC